MAQPPTVEDLQRRIRTLEDKIAEYEISMEEMEKSEEWYSQIVQSSPIAKFVIDDRHRIITCNRAYEKMTGIPAREILGTDNHWKTFYSSKRPILADLIVDNATEETIAGYYSGKYRKSATISGAYEVEDFFPTLGERGKWLFFTAAPLKDAEGNITGALETLQDITKQKRAALKLYESERRLRTLFDFAPYPIVVFTREGVVYYLNPAFTDIFGWAIAELEGHTIPFEPPKFEGETQKTIKQLIDGAPQQRFETRRLTRDGRQLEIIIRAAGYSDVRGKATGVLMTLRDATKEKKEARNRETIHKISLALPAHPELKKLLRYISGEVRRLMGSEGAMILPLDKERDEFYALGASYEDREIEERVMASRFPVNTLVAGEVLKTGQPVIVNDASEASDLSKARDEKLGYQTRNLILVPLRTRERKLGVLGAVNKKEGVFEQSDIELLDTIGSTVALSIENARYAEKLKQAYEEVSSLNRAKDKVIQHLSHELRTPVAVLAGSFSILAKKLAALPDTAWRTTLERSQRNLDRIVEIQDEVSDIIEERQYEIKDHLSKMLAQCTDELETLLADEVGEGTVVERVRERIDAIFGPRDLTPVWIQLPQYVDESLKALRPLFAHRKVRIHSDLNKAPAVFIPREVMEKVFNGLIKNAVENTPDGGKIEVQVQKKGKGSSLVVHDYGVGITEDAQRRIFEGFFPTSSTMAYSSRRPFDFGAGGKGADLLRMKIFAGRYGFEIDMSSSRCRFIPGEGDGCPGNIEACTDCASETDCLESGGTTFTLYFPPN